MSMSQPRNTNTIAGLDTLAWKWMRYSAFLLIPLAWGHVLIQDILVGGHQIDLDYVSLRWSMIGWRIYDFCLLSFAFAHGINGLRQILYDYILNGKYRRVAAWALLAAWVVISAIGAVAIIGGVRLSV
jgi:succinate dehydrogenase / fumarate reductase membrane anchor subunit